MDRREDDNLSEGQPPEIRYLEISLDRRRWWIGLLTYLLLYVVVAAVLVWFFVQISTPFRLALVIVTVMVAYMALMGWWASGTIDRRG